MNASASPRKVTAKGVARVAPEIQAPVTPAVDGMTSFGHDLLRTLVADAEFAGRNVVVSPLSLAYAFGMVRAGAEGETARQIDDTFGFPALVHAALNAVSHDLVTAEAPPRTSQPRRRGEEPAEPVVAMANAVFVDDALRPRAEFLRTLATHYGAGVQAMDLSAPTAADHINAWVRKQTAERIEKLFDTVDPRTLLVLANAIYLKADWAASFEPASTKEEAFRLADGGAVTVPMMRQEASIRYASGDGWQAVELPYAKSDLAMWVIVPRDADGGTGGKRAVEEGGSPTELLTRDGLRAVGSGLERTRVRISMPRFDFGTDIRLETVLKKLGMTEPFDPHQANFDGIDPAHEDLHIRQAVHRANITVDEYGTEAAAVTGVGIGIVSAPPPAEVEVRADRPFAFAVVHTENQVPLFLGTVTDPRRS
ncbi:MAG TPA: serpin family protein [Actinopolymorphaceae bacterium]